MSHPTSVATADRRGVPRVPGPFDGFISGPSDHRAVRISDLSETGCFVESFDPMAPGARLQLRIDIPHCGPVVLVGDVRYFSPRFGLGVHFVDVPRETARTLRAAIETHLDKQE